MDLCQNMFYFKNSHALAHWEVSFEDNLRIVSQNQFVISLSYIPSIY